MLDSVRKQISGELYSAFTDVSRPKMIESCSCCHSGDEKRMLLTTNRQQIPKDLILELEYSWLNTFGDEHVVRYFMPCILNAYLMDDVYFDEEAIYDLLERAGFFEWSLHQQKAVKRAYIALCKSNQLKVPEKINQL